MGSIQLSLFDGKVCPRCRQWLPTKKFRKNPSCREGIEPVCKACYTSPEAAEHKKAHDREYYRKHRERALSNAKRYQEENWDRRRLEMKAWREKNANVLRPKKKAYREALIAADPESFYATKRERSKEYRQKYPEKLRETGHNARAKRMQVPGRWTAAQWRALLDHYGLACLRCGETKKLFRDHLIPLAKGGTNDIGNLQPLCHNCNSRKHVDATDYRPDGGAFARSLMEARLCSSAHRSKKS